MIKVENLVKEFGTKKAVNGVSFSVERGEILGFLGPNGAGKSTTMRMITGFIPPTSGRVTVGGYDITENPVEAKRLIGYLPESAPSYSDMTVRGFLSFTAELRGINGAKRDEAIQRVVGLCSLEGVLHQSVDTLSKGFRHRTCLAQSLIHDPQILILDEPTDGLDPNQKHEVRQLLKRLGQNKAIIFSTHILEEVDACCTRAIIIDHGVVRANGTPAELRSQHDIAGSVSLRVHGTAAETVKSRLSSLSLAHKTTVHGSNGIVTARVFPKHRTVNGDLSRAIADLVSKEGWHIDELHTEDGRLDEVFRGITRPDTVQTREE
jgi:ABC-2 type transport system ATP-binding protein